MKYFYIFICCFFFQFGFSQNDTIITFGENLIDQNKFDEAINYFQKCLITPKDEEQKVHILIGLAEIYKLKLNYKIANNYYVKAFEVIKKTGNKELEFLYHVKMAEFYRKRGLFNESVKQLNSASILSKVTAINDTYLSRFYSRKAALFTEHFFQRDSTFFYANKALLLAQKNNDKDLIFYSTLEIAGYYEEKFEYKTAIFYLENLIESAKKNNFVQQQTDAQINYTRLLIKDNQLNKALDVSLKALDFSKKNDLFFGEMLFTDNIRNIYAKLGNMSKAYEYSKERTKLTEAYYKKEHDKFLFELEEKYKLTEKDNQIKIKNLEIANTTKALASSKFNLYVSIALFLLAIAIALFISYFLNKSKQSNIKLKAVSQENKFLLSEANHRINNNLQLVIILISDQLKKLPLNQQSELKNILKKIDSIATLHSHLYQNPDKSTIDSQKYLKEILINFNELFKENDIEIEYRIDSFMISTDFAMYLGLLLTELCINSMKHAFDSQNIKKINFELKFTDNIIMFLYSDNGNQIINENIRPKLIDKLCRQLNLKYTINTSEGFSFFFRHPIK